MCISGGQAPAALLRCAPTTQLAVIANRAPHTDPGVLPATLDRKRTLMTGLRTSAPEQSSHGTTAGGLLATMSSDSLLVAADALRAWGAEIDADEIERWVAHQPTRRHLNQHILPA